MDPATCFQLACGAIQLIDFGVKTAKTLREIYKNQSALSSENSDTDATASQIQDISGDIHSVLNRQKLENASLTNDQQRLKDIVIDCKRSSDELRDKLAALKQNGPIRKRDVPGIWLKGLTEKSSIENSQARLEKCQKMLDTALLSNVCQGINIQDAKQREVLGKINIATAQSTEAFRDLDKSFQAIAADLQKQLAEDGKKTRDLIQTLDHKAWSRDVVQRLLDSLEFETINTREEEIHEAYAETFQWIFNDSGDAVGPWCNFVEWLESGKEIYWINGKPASGKSTLMSYIVQHPRFEKLLKIWSNDENLLVVKFFFWRAGTNEQKSINGLLRSILFQLISANPIYASALPPKSKNFPVWTDKRLTEALNLVLKHDDFETKVCFVIDGLDEFEGDQDAQTSLVSLIKRISQNPGVKVVLSSRPEPLLYESFEMCAGLRLQELTKHDIRLYVKGRLLDEPRMRRYQSESPEEVLTLIEDVCDKADGVFLWVRLAVQDLVGGLRARDPLSCLYERLALLNGSLNGLFAQLLTRIHPVHTVQAANLLKFMMFYYRSRNTTITSLLHVAFALREELTSKLFEIVDSTAREDDHVEWCTEQFEDLRLVLLTHSANLLDVQVPWRHDDEGNFSMLQSDSLDKQEHRQLSQLAYFFRQVHDNTHVTFIHRSVLDFLLENQEAITFVNKSTFSDHDLIESAFRSLMGISRTNMLISRTLTLDYDNSDHLSEAMRTIASAMVEIDEFFHELRSDLNGRELSIRSHYYSGIASWLIKDTKRILQVHQERGDPDWFYKSFGKWAPTLYKRTSSSVLEYGWPIFAALAGYVPPEHILVVHLVHQDTEWLLANLSYEHGASMDVIFPQLLRKLRNQFTKLDANAFRILSQLCSKLFKIGLEPNGKCSLVSYSDYLSIKNLKYPQRYTAWEYFLTWLFYNRWLLDARGDPIVQLVVYFLDLFLQHGANVNALAYTSREITDDGCESVIRISALRVLKLLQSDNSDLSPILRHIEALGAVDILRPGPILRRSSGPYLYCELTDEQQAQLVPLYEGYLVPRRKVVMEDDSEEPDINYSKQMRDLVDSIWQTNEHFSMATWL